MRYFTKPLNFDIVKSLYENRLQAFAFYRTKWQEAQMTTEEVVLGGKGKVQQLGARFKSFENDETWLEDALTHLFLERKLSVQHKYSFAEVVKIVREAMGEHNRFLRECARQSEQADHTSRVTPADEALIPGVDEIITIRR